MQTYSMTHHLDGHEVATYEPRKNHDALVVKSPDGLHSATFVLAHSTPAPLRLAFLRSLAHAAEELAEQIELAEQPSHPTPPGPSGPPRHTHDDGTTCQYVRRGGIDRWRAIDGNGWDLGPCPDLANRGLTLADQHIAEAKAAAGIALATTDSEYDR